MIQHVPLPEWLDRALAALRSGDIDAWMAIYGDDAVHAFPFAPEGMPSRLEGREAIDGYMRMVFGKVRFGQLSALRVRQVGDETIVEARGHHRRLVDDARLDIDLVWIITRRDGRVVDYRDYMNPLQLASL